MGLFGLLFGSFANVVVWRLPRGESIVRPGSYCPSCDTPLAWYDNIPLLSYALLRGRCRACHAPISRRYPAVEAVSGGLFVVAGVLYGVSLQAVFAAVFLWGLLVLSLIDAAHFRLPNAIVGALAIVGLVGAILSQVLGVPVVPLIGMATSGPMAEPLVAALVGALAAGGLSFVFAEGYALLRKRRGFGMGDVKLLSVLGLFIGLYAFMALFIGSLLGSIYAIARARTTTRAGLGSAKLPFGAFLALGTFVCLLVGQPAWHWYLQGVGLS
jgi:leader peptidase (prepilin peptidase)/N-methyltransferase